MTSLFGYIKKHRIFFLSIAFFAIFSVTVSYATPPSSPYSAGQTLDPACAPGSSNCTVAISSGGTSQWDDVANGINYAGGNVGIGTTTPNSMLSIFNTGTPSRYVTIGQSDSLRYFEVGDHTIQMGDIDTGTGALFTVDHPNHLFGFDRGAIVVNGDGSINVGVAYNNVAGHALMEVNGGGAYQAGYYIFKDGAEKAQIAVMGGSDDLSFNMAGTERMRITAAGNVGIGTTNPITALDLEGDGAIIAVGTEGAGVTVPDLGAGTRMMWIPSSDSFRAGVVDSTQWDSANIGFASAAFNYDTIASGFGATAFGAQTIASGAYSAAFGSGTQALQQNSVAFGSLSAANGANSAAFGTSTITFGSNTVAFGESSNAFGVDSAAFGYSTSTPGYFSTAFGYTTIARASNSFVIGRYNIGNGDTNAWLTTDPLFEIGNGDVGQSSDAFIVLKNGKTGIALDPISPNPTYMLQVGSGVVSAGIVARFENATGTCDINPTTASLVCSSDMNLKQNITMLADNSVWSFNGNVSLENQSVLAKVLALNPVSYNWKNEAPGSTKHPGFIAQDVQKIFPDLVATDAKTGLLSLNTTGLIPYTVEAIKEMDLNITAIAELDRPNTWRESLVSWLGSATNGITNIFSKQVTTPTLCVGTNDNKTCITKDQLDHLLQNQGGTTTVIGGGASAPDAPIDTPPANDQTPATDPVEVAPPAEDAHTEPVPPVETPTADPAPSADQTQ